MAKRVDRHEINMDNGGLYLENYDDMNKRMYYARLGGETFADGLFLFDDTSDEQTFTSYARDYCTVVGDITATGDINGKNISNMESDIDSLKVKRSIKAKLESNKDISVQFINVFIVGGEAHVNVEFKLKKSMPEWTAIATGLPIAKTNWFDVAHSWGRLFSRNARVVVNKAGEIKVRYGAAGIYDASFVYPIG